MAANTAHGLAGYEAASGVQKVLYYGAKPA